MLKSWHFDLIEFLIVSYFPRWIWKLYFSPTCAAHEESKWSLHFVLFSSNYKLFFLCYVSSSDNFRELDPSNSQHIKYIFFHIEHIYFQFLGQDWNPSFVATCNGIVTYFLFYMWYNGLIIKLLYCKFIAICEGCYSIQNMYFKLFCKLSSSSWLW